MKKTLVWLLVLCMALGLTPVWGASAGEAPVTISYLFGGDNTPTSQNAVLDEIEKRTGVRMDAIYVPGGDFKAKLNTLIAARNLPDIFSTSGSEAVEFRDQGMLLQLDDLLATYGPHIMAEVGEDLHISPLNAEDETYGFFKGALNYSSNLSVRTDWLKKLGLDMPTDLDSFYEVLHAFTFDDPDGNGKDDTVGYVCTMNGMRTFEHIFGAFGICVDTDYLLADGTVTTYMKAPRYLEAIAYLRKLYQEGILDPDFATLPLMSAFEKLWTGRTGTFDFQCVGTTNNWMPGRYTENPVPTFDFAVIAGPGGAGGCIKQYPSYTYYTVIASTCKNPEAAMKLLDFLCSEEGDELTYLGVEGVHYQWMDKENGKYELLGEYKDAATHRAAGAFVYNTQWPLYNAEVRTMNKQTQEGQAFARAHWVDHPDIMAPLAARTEYGTQLGDITKEALANLIVTTGDVKAEYDAFVARWETEGGLEFEKEATAAYNAEQGK